MKSKIKLILASASPRRRELLAQLGCKFSIESANIDETRHDSEPANLYVQRLAEEKAAYVLSQHKANDIAVLGADTIVRKDDTVFGKPENKDDARRIWQLLSNSSHQVTTAVSLQYPENANFKIVTTAVTTTVEFGSISDQQMERYWGSGEPQDKAGAYGIQGLASAWVKLIHGSYSGVVGLPLRETNELLRKINHHWL